MCDSCEALMINGVFCHETGCPQAPVGCKRDCKECGTEFVVQNLSNTLFCSDDCGDAYYGL